MGLMLQRFFARQLGEQNGREPCLMLRATLVLILLLICSPTYGSESGMRELLGKQRRRLIRAKSQRLQIQMKLENFSGLQAKDMWWRQKVWETPVRPITPRCNARVCAAMTN